MKLALQFALLVSIAFGVVLWLKWDRLHAAMNGEPVPAKSAAEKTLEDAYGAVRGQ